MTFVASAFFATKILKYGEVPLLGLIAYTNVIDVNSIINKELKNLPEIKDEDINRVKEDIDRVAEDMYRLGMRCAYKVNVVISCAIAYFANASLTPLADSLGPFVVKHISQSLAMMMPVIPSFMINTISKVSELFSIYVNVPLVPLIVIAVAMIGAQILMYKKMKQSEQCTKKHMPD